MKIGIVGSGGIVTTFIEAVNEVEGIEIVALCCRSKSIEKGKQLAEKGDFHKVYTDYICLLADEEVEVIYVALPNHLHYEYTKQALEAGKHVINEKPFTSTLGEAEKLIQLAKDKGLFLFEAIMTIHLPHYHLVKEKLRQIGRVKLVTCNFSQYSSRYDAFLKGEVHPVFDPEASGGALMDINIYNLHFVIGLFGQMQQVNYQVNKAANGIDTSGIVTLKYQDFQAVCIGAKDCNGENTCMIQGEKGYIKVEGAASQCLAVEVHLNHTSPQRYTLQNTSNRMAYELLAFKGIIENKDHKVYDELLTQTLQVMEAAVAARKAGGIIFKADKESI